MTIPGVGQLTALAFVAAIDGPDRFRKSRDVGPYLGLVPRRWKSGEIDYTGSISKCGDRRVRTLLYEAANVILTRYGGDLALKDWVLASASVQQCERRVSPSPGGSPSSCTPCSGTAPSSKWLSRLLKKSA
jgi:transposase